MKLEIWVEKLLKFTLGLLLFLLPWQTIWIYQEQFLNGVKWEYGTLGFYATEVLLWFAVFLFVVWFWKRRKAYGLRHKDVVFRWSKDRIFLMSCLLFIGYCLLSIIWAGDSSVALQRALHIMEAFLLFFMLYLGPLSIRSAMKWFIAGAVVQSVLGIWQFLSQATFSSTILGMSAHPVFEAGTSIIQSEEIGRWLRAYGGFSHPNVLGGYLVVAFVFVLILLGERNKIQESKEDTRNKIQDTRYQTRYKIQDTRYKFVFLFLVSCFLITALFFTFSRSAWIAGVVVFLCLPSVALAKEGCCVGLYKRKKEFIIYHLSSIIFIVALVVIFFPLVQTRVLGNTTHEVQSVSERVSGYGEAWELFKQNPILGVGVGNYTFAAYQLDSDRPGWTYQPVHNYDLLFLVELGIIGGLLFISIILSFIIYYSSSVDRHLSLLKKKEQNLNLFIIFLIPIAILAVFDHYLFSSYIGIFLTAVYLAIILRFLPQSLHN